MSRMTDRERVKWASEYRQLLIEKEMMKKDKTMNLDIFFRDDFTCALCGANDTKIKAYDINADKDSEEYLSGYNLITLCNDCYKDVDEDTTKELLTTLKVFANRRAKRRLGI